jgi:hypothetical protein
MREPPTTCSTLLTLVAVMMVVTFWGGVLYVAWHFVVKYW